MQVVCNIIFKREEFPDLEVECDDRCVHIKLHEPTTAKSRRSVCTEAHHCIEERCVPLDDNELRGEYFRCLLEGRI